MYRYILNAYILEPSSGIVLKPNRLRIIGETEKKSLHARARTLLLYLFS